MFAVRIAAKVHEFFCIYCKTLKLESCWSKGRQESSGFIRPCDDCTDIQQRAKKYKLSLRDYHKILDKQNHCCSICKRPFDGTMPRIDHCHDKGHVRGLLCHTCNTGIGFFKDNKEWLANAIKYLAVNRYKTILGKKANTQSTTDYKPQVIDNK